MNNLKFKRFILGLVLFSKYHPSLYRLIVLIPCLVFSMFLIFSFEHRYLWIGIVFGIYSIYYTVVYFITKNVSDWLQTSDKPIDKMFDGKEVDWQTANLKSTKRRSTRSAAQSERKKRSSKGGR